MSEAAYHLISSHEKRHATRRSRILTTFTSSATLLTAVSFAFVYLTAIFYTRSIAYRDPTSAFFDPHRGYLPSYSAVRQDQAEAFIIASKTDLTRTRPKEQTHQKKFCVGIPSVARNGTTYLRSAVGSLLDGLSEQERNDIHLVVFIAQTDPSVHFAYKENWLHNLTDKVLLYDLPRKEMEHVIELEQTGNSREKGLFDYTYLLRTCYAQGADHIAMFEDDIVALDGWYHRTINGLDIAEKQTALRKASLDFLYLRLFYTEEFLGWNSEEWKTYLFWSLIVTAAVATSLASLRLISRTAKKAMTPKLLVAVFAIYLPLSILLFFAAGRVTVLPLPNGVNEMPRYGCCSQGLVFPRDSAKLIIDFFEERKLGYVDMLIEEYADAHASTRWALTPSVIQHVGRKSSKGDDYGEASKYKMTVAETLWNFGFEDNDVGELRREHLDAIGRHSS
ncbi:hypothetical protein D6D27_03088 [Aureobasidium pullulans]|nr:hypothetical protein D6D27_03088 [Aureobasidium pullulans]